MELAEFVLVFGLAAAAIYLALGVRRALFVRVYRNQAVGIVAASAATIFYGLVILSSLPAPNTSTLIGAIEGPVVFYITYGALFYAVDASVRTSRFSDPLLRDPLHWKQLRKVLWAVDLFSMFYLIVYAGIVEGGAQTPLFIIPIILPLVAGAVFFPLMSRRSGDPLFRRHLVWLGLFFLTSLVAFFANFGSAEIAGVLLILGSFCLYRAARTLAPLNPLAKAGGPNEARGA